MTNKKTTKKEEEKVDPADVTTFDEDDDPLSNVGDLVDDGPIKVDD